LAWASKFKLPITISLSMFSEIVFKFNLRIVFCLPMVQAFCLMFPQKLAIVIAKWEETQKKGLFYQLKIIRVKNKHFQVWRKMVRSVFEYHGGIKLCFLSVKKVIHYPVNCFLCHVKTHSVSPTALNLLQSQKRLLDYLNLIKLQTLNWICLGLNGSRCHSKYYILKQFWNIKREVPWNVLWQKKVNC